MPPISGWASTLREPPRRGIPPHHPTASVVHADARAGTSPNASRRSRLAARLSRASRASIRGQSPRRSAAKRTLNPNRRHGANMYGARTCHADVTTVTSRMPPSASTIGSVHAALPAVLRPATSSTAGTPGSRPATPLRPPPQSPPGEPAGRCVAREDRGARRPPLGHPLGALHAPERLAGDPVLVAETGIAAGGNGANG